MMAKIVRPAFGTSCHECGEQVPMARVRALGLENNPTRVFCTPCASTREARVRRARLAERARDTVIIRG